MPEVVRPYPGFFGREFGVGQRAGEFRPSATRGGGWHQPRHRNRGIENHEGGLLSPCPCDPFGQTRTGEFRARQEHSLEDAAIQLRKEVPKETPGNILSYQMLFFVFFDANKDGVFTKEEWMGTLQFLKSNANNVMAIRPGGHGNISTTHIAWKADRGLSEMPSPLFYRDRLYFVRDGGLLTSYDPATTWIRNGPLGVDLFFVISGFLMGSILFAEFKASGKLEVARFYVRRFLRLIPVSIVIMAMCLYFLHGLPGEPVWNYAENCWANLLYVNNFLSRTQQYMGWCWSLAIEEQFYLLLAGVTGAFLS